jgi:NADPH:quinone reductase-like Zn-dependent oxidoreductase
MYVSAGFFDPKEHDMRAARIHRFGPPDVIVLDDLARPAPDPDQVLIRVAAAGVGPWDALIREQKSAVKVALPLTLGADLSGIVEETGDHASHVKPGDRVYGATNPQFIGACAEYALASASMIAKMPVSLSFDEAASAPVVAVTAWQMLFAKAQPGQSVLIQGAGGNVGAYAVQLARQAPGARHLRIALPRNPLALPRRGFQQKECRGKVTSERLDRLTDLFDHGELKTRVAISLPLDQVRMAHEMLAGAPHPGGKIVLHIADLP